MSKYHYTVSENNLITPTVRSVKMVCDEGRKPLLFEPGQYAAISLHDQIRPTTTRCFSIASSPNKRSELEFCARVGGDYTQALERLEAGDRIVVRGPFGHFVLKDQENQNLVFLAGGIGVTPFMSMIRYASELQLKHNIHLIFSCRNQNDIPFFEELTLLENKNPRLRITFIIAGGDTDRFSNSEFIVGRLDDTTVRSLGLNFSHQTYMICGPGGYIKAMQNLLADHGVPHSRILSEAFNQGSGSSNSLQMSWPLNAYASSGLLLMIFGGFVVTSDLIKTLPTLEASYAPEITEVQNDIVGINANVLSNIKSIPPQVDTDTTQEPILVTVPNDEKKTVNSTPTPTPVVTTPAPVVVKPTPVVVTPTPAPVVATPAPTPTKTVTTTSKPKTKRS